MNKAYLRVFTFTLFVVVLFSLSYYYHLNNYLSVDGFNNYNRIIETYQHQHMLSFILEYMALYIFLIACCMPGTILLDLLAGFLFGIYIGSILVTVAYLFGSVVNFLVIHYIFKGLFKNKFVKFKRIVLGNSPKYLFLNLISLRLIPVIPASAVNVAAALVGVELSTFFFATLIGVIPISIIYALIGDGVHDTLVKHQMLNAHVLADPKIWLPLVCIAASILVSNFIVNSNKK